MLDIDDNFIREFTLDVLVDNRCGKVDYGNGTRGSQSLGAPEDEIWVGELINWRLQELAIIIQPDT